MEIPKAKAMFPTFPTLRAQEPASAPARLMGWPDDWAHILRMATCIAQMSNEDACIHSVHDLQSFSSVSYTSLTDAGLHTATQATERQGNLHG